MLKYNNNHIFTGYLKQLLSSFSLPACKIYTREFAAYLEKFGKEDPRILKSFNAVNKEHPAVRINYLKNNELYNYFWAGADNLETETAAWKKSAKVYYTNDKFIPGLSRQLNSPGINYDTKTHEYLGDYLRFIRDYYNINLMSLYNCFTDKIYNNVYFNFILNPRAPKTEQITVVFNAQEPESRVYALPVKLFADYTIAVDCEQGIEMFCGLYNTNLDMSKKAEDLAARTYQRVHKTMFKQPFLYDKLNIKYWLEEADFNYDTNGRKKSIRTDKFTRWDIANLEKDLKLFIKVPSSCRSSITILEGDYRSYNDVKYSPVSYKASGERVNPRTDRSEAVGRVAWEYRNNRCILNFDHKDTMNVVSYSFKPISQLQLLAINTGESYPFADRLIEYLSGSAIMPIDEIPDNIKRIQKVMKENGHYFKIEGLWEDEMQGVLYDYIMNSGPVVPENGKLVDRHQGYHRSIGHASKSRLFDVLGYADKDAEKWYASWKQANGRAVVGESLQNVDIYDGLYDI
jgi:hypothetical protein